MKLPLLLLSLATMPSHTNAPTSANTSQDGPAVPGICLLSRPAVFAHSKVGQAATDRLKALSAQAQTEIDIERKQFELDRQSLQNQSTSLPATDRQERERALLVRGRALEQKATLLTREIEATREKALGRITAEMQPVTRQLYLSRGCGLLIDRNAVFLGNMSNDLTASVVQALDARISTISFDLEALAPNDQSAPSKP